MFPVSTETDMCRLLRSLKFSMLVVMCLHVMPVIKGRCNSDGIRLCDVSDDIETSFRMVPGFLVNTTSPRRHKERYMHGEKDCYKAVFGDGEKATSTCPVYYILNFDAHREPAIIAEARCACVNCNYRGVDFCEPVYYLRSVVEIDTKQNCGRRVVRRFQNGCACKKPVTMAIRQ